MKLKVASASCAIVILTGCGGGVAEVATVTVTQESSPAEETSPSPDPTTSAAEPAQDATSTEPTEAESEVETGVATEPTDSSAGDAPTGTGHTSSRGNLIKQVGEKAGVTNEGGEPIWEFTFTKIEPNFSCTHEYSEPPANGNFIAIHVDSQTFPALGEEEWFSTVDFNPYAFTIFSPDGQRENDSQGNAYACLSESESVPYDIGPAERISGVVVLDSQHDSGTVVFKPSILEGGGWEWDF